MDEFIKEALIENGLMEKYLERPAYQQNDYIGWITRAVKKETKQKRLSQMLSELEDGGLYMKMKHRG
ncbi:MAG: YdeI/OmpD-associated family protein [Actinomycetota bacterium]|nr:YdeI/OmpD-associated family protein [Actinomycetota bacterium]